MNNLRGIWRGKRLDNGEWVEGFYGCVTDNYTPKNIHNITTFATSDNGEIILTGLYAVVSSTLGECVGFRDKSRIPMFEGDVVTYKSTTGKTWVAKIIYSVNKCRFVQETSNGQMFEIARKYANCYEVIGNIHDNPKLLI